MRFSTFVLKNLLRRPARTGLTVVGITLAVAAVVALVGAAHGLEKSFLQLYNQHGVDVVVLRAGVAEARFSSLDIGLGARIAAIPGVRAVTPAMMDSVSFTDRDLIGVTVQGWQADSFMFPNLRIVAGRKLAEGDGKVVMLGALLAKNLEVQTGDTLEIVEGEPFEVIGVFESFSVFENSSMIVPLVQLQRLMDRPGQVTGYNIDVTEGADSQTIEQLCAEVRALASGLEAMKTGDFVTQNSQLKIVRGMAWMTSSIALVIGGVGMLNTMIMSVFERTREIGILRAIGWRKSRVVGMILAEALVLSLLGAFFGILIAVVAIRFLGRLPQAGGLIAGQIDPRVIVQGLIIAVGVGLLGGAYPALRGAQLLPTEALRHE